MRERAFKALAAAIQSLFPIMLLLPSPWISASDLLPNNESCQITNDMSSAQRGECLFVSAQKGHCASCHAIDANETSLDIGPPLADVIKRHPDASVLRAWIWDPTVNNPNSVMPPYGRHAILSEPEIDDLVAFLSTL